MSSPGVAETHSAWVVFLDDRAYKIKKPVDLGFLDFSTREQRERALHRELELNRRLAPDVYLDVLDVIGSDGAPYEHVLVMRRLPEDRRLSSLIERGEDVDDDLRAVARVVAAFHARAETSSAIAGAGAPAVLRAKISSDLDELEAFVPELLDRESVEAARRLSMRYLAGRLPLLERRVERGFVRDGHGDLLADDVFCLPDGPRILDCIEFDDRLRHGDVLADVAFLAMDLERLGAPELATRFLDRYGEFSGEHHPRSLGDYYVAARALVRVKVACIRAEQGDERANVAARELMQLALEHLRAAQACLVVVGGPPGTGKSTVAQGLGARLGWVVLRSDEVRKDVTGVGRAMSAPAPPDRGIYTPEVTHETYSMLLDRAALALHAGESVVLDATWSEEGRRRRARRVALDASADVVELRCELPEVEAAARIARRRAEGVDVSDADPEVAAALRAAFEPWPDARVISTMPPPDDVVDAAARVVGDQRAVSEKMPAR
jgi:aminoglycoside phosphotransferase family enzyme/predicted kinase